MWRLSVIAVFLACTFVPTHTTVGLAEQPTTAVQSSDPFISLARLELRHGFWAQLLDSGNDSCAGVEVDTLQKRLPVEGFGTLAKDEMERLCEVIKRSSAHLVSEIVPEQYWEAQLGAFYARVLSAEEASSFVMGYANVAGSPAEVRLEQLRRQYFQEVLPEILPALRNMGRPFRIPNGSMAPSLLIGDHIMVNQLAYQNLAPARGDVVAFKFPEDESKIFVKLIIGIPGDTIEIRDKLVHVNGQALREEDYTQHVDSNIIGKVVNPRDNLDLLKIPEQSYFVLGDNRDLSLDSRFWGAVKREKIIGKVTLIYWSWDNITKSTRWDRGGRRLP
jgi:signal peptidase I